MSTPPETPPPASDKPDPTAELSPAELSPAELSPAESSPAESSPAESAPVEPVAVELAPAEPVPAEPVAAEPVAAEPVATAPVATAPVAAAPEPQAEPQAAAGAEPQSDFPDAYISEPDPEDLIEPEIEDAPPEIVFDFEKDAIPNFAKLLEWRPVIFRNPRSKVAFSDSLDGMEDSGEPGRRKGLGLWIVGRYTESASQLANYDDDVATFTRATALMSIERAEEALPLFEGLSKAYPEEPRPRSGAIQARAEIALAAAGDDEPEGAIEVLEKSLGDAPESFAASADGEFLTGWLAELRREWETALDHYFGARDADPTHRRNLFHLGHLAERWGLDEEAVEAYETLVSLSPPDRNVLMNLGVLYEDLGQDQEAAACYDTIVRALPTDRQARLYLADARAGMDMYYDEDQERKEDRLNQILRIPITDFELSVRARNCLNKMNILSLGDLVRKSEPELLSYKNFGETSLNEIKEILGSKGLRLGMARDEAVASIESSARRYTSGENVEAMNMSIQELELSIRARRTVEALGCLTLGDIVQHSEDELLGMPNFGVTSLHELKEKLTEQALSLKAKDNKGPGN